MLTGILGGGLAGISLQHFLSGNSEVLEKEDRPGGLCRTFRKGGFAYDLGGHILFSRSQELLDILLNVLGENAHTRRRNNRILFKGRDIKYPFENGLSGLEKQDIYECLIGYLVNEHPPPNNFKEWILHTFGDGIADKYLIPYNEKIWKLPLEEIGLEWVERVPRPPLEDVIKSALGIETEGYVHQLNFIYPARGGIESLIAAFMKQGANVTTAFEVERISAEAGGWFVSGSGGHKFYDRLVLTMPVREALRRMDNIPQGVMAAAEALRYNSLRVILIGVGNSSLMDKSAVYIPDPGVTPHRICFMGFFSEDNVPPGKSSLIAEVTVPPGHELEKISDASLTEMVVDDLHRVGIIDRRDVVETEVTNITYGYVIHDLAHKRNTAIIKDYFASLGIHLHGRFAEFEYINMDEVIKRSMTLAAKLNDQEA